MLPIRSNDRVAVHARERLHTRRSQRCDRAMKTNGGRHAASCELAVSP